MCQEFAAAAGVHFGMSADWSQLSDSDCRDFLESLMTCDLKKSHLILKIKYRENGKKINLLLFSKAEIQIHFLVLTLKNIF